MPKQQSVVAEAAARTKSNAERLNALRSHAAKIRATIKDAKSTATSSRQEADATSKIHESKKGKESRATTDADTLDTNQKRLAIIQKKIKELE